MVAMDFFAASNSYDFLKSVLFKFAEKSDSERVKLWPLFLACITINYTVIGAVNIFSTLFSLFQEIQEVGSLKWQMYRWAQFKVCSYLFVWCCRPANVMFYIHNHNHNNYNIFSNIATYIPCLWQSEIRNKFCKTAYYKGTSKKKTLYLKQSTTKQFYT